MDEKTFLQFNEECQAQRTKTLKSIAPHLKFFNPTTSVTIDFGSSKGTSLDQIIKLGFRGPIYCADKDVKSLYQLPQHPNIRPLHVDLETGSVPLGDQSVVYAQAKNLSHLLSNTGNLLREAYRLLVSNGIFFFESSQIDDLETYQKVYEISREEKLAVYLHNAGAVSQEIKNIGFTILHEVPIEAQYGSDAGLCFYVLKKN